MDGALKVKGPFNESRLKAIVLWSRIKAQFGTGTVWTQIWFLYKTPGCLRDRIEGLISRLCISFFLIHLKVKP